MLYIDAYISDVHIRICICTRMCRYEDSALVRAARLGRVLVVDEADKAPLEVV